MQIGNAGELWQGILSDNIFRSMGNGYLMLLCSSPIEFLLFLRPAAEERGTETKNRKVEDKNNKEGKNNREGKDDKAIRDIITAVAGANTWPNSHKPVRMASHQNDAANPNAGRVLRTI